MGKKVDFNCKIRWAKITEGSRDMGPGDDSDTAKRIESEEGRYNAVLVLSDDTAEYLKSQGITDKGLSGQLWGTTEEGEITYKVKRPHVNPKIIDKDTGKPVYYGPPKVLLETEEGNVPWNESAHGRIGNDSEVKVRLDVLSKYNIVTLELVKIIDLIEYEGGGDMSEEELAEF